jgi:hypothetical protein
MKGGGPARDDVRTRVGRDLYSAFLARFVQNDRLDARQTRAAWRAAEACLRAASNGFDPGAGGEAGEVYPPALVSAARTSESGAMLDHPDSS